MHSLSLTGVVLFYFFRFYPVTRRSLVSPLSLSHSEIDLHVTVYIVPSPDESKLLYTSTAVAAVSKVYTHNIQTYIGVPLCTFRRRGQKAGRMCQLVCVPERLVVQYVCVCTT